MLTLIAITGVLLGVTLVVGLVAAVVFLVNIRRFLADTHPALRLVAENVRRLGGHLEGVHQVTQAAVTDLPVERT